ncbi:hypothetical protein Lsai_3467 [Legionella sainthelensi]|uniref:Uncharacterized protein n=1 Tax=Legionella sainthelensi TaxID=28087 RepID=A0A0W0YCN8_9GAMM|nr:hypothetical protein Lsai_3467 [Legionella sainthelensi]VEH33699.1 Uncharacterised protein [Legionella sainthelensi]
MLQKTELCQSYLDKRELILLNRGLYYENKLALPYYKRTEQLSYFYDVIDLIVSAQIYKGRITLIGLPFRK